MWDTGADCPQCLQWRDWGWRQREKDDLQRDNAALRKKPFGFSSEKRPPDKDAPACLGWGPSGDSGGEAGSPRKRGGQPGARSHKRVQREGLPVR